MQLTSDTASTESARPDVVMFACTRVAVQPLPYSQTPSNSRRFISICRPPIITVNLSSPWVIGEDHWICFATFLLLSLKNENLIHLGMSAILKINIIINWAYWLSHKWISWLWKFYVLALRDVVHTHTHTHGQSHSPGTVQNSFTNDRMQWKHRMDIQV